MSGGPVAAEIDDGNASAGLQIFFQTFQVLGLIADVVQRVNDGDQVYGFGQLRVGFGARIGLMLASFCSCAVRSTCLSSSESMSTA